MLTLVLRFQRMMWNWAAEGGTEGMLKGRAGQFPKTLPVACGEEIAGPPLLSA